MPRRSHQLNGPAQQGALLRGAVLTLILLGFILRVLRLEFQPLWWDEGYSVWFGTHPLGQMVALTALDIHPPLYYAFLHGWTFLLGTDPVVLRLLSVAVGVLMIPAIYVVARRMFTPRAALLAALLATVNPLAIFYSQEVRMYGLVALLSTGVLMAAWQVLGRGFEPGLLQNAEAALGPRPELGLRAEGESRPRPAAMKGGRGKSLLLYILLTTAALYTQYYAIFLPAGLTLFALWQWWRGRRTHDTPERAQSDLPRTNVTLSGLVSQPPKQRTFSEKSEGLERRDSSLSPLRGRPVGMEPLRMTARRRANFALGYWLGAQVVVALLYLPWVIYAGPKLVPYVSQKVVQDADRPLGLLAYLGRHLSAFLAGHLEGPLAPYWPAVLLLLIPVALGLIWAMKPSLKPSANQQIDESANQRISHDLSATLAPALERSASAGVSYQPSAIRNPQHRPEAVTGSAIVMLLLILASALLLGWLVGLRYPFFPERGERLLLLALPALLLLVVAGLDALLRRAPAAGYAVLGTAVAVSAASLVAFYATPRYADNDYRPLIARIVEQGLPGDTVFAVYPWQAGYWRAYGDPNGPVDLLTPSVTWGAPVIGELETALKGGRVWFPAHLSLGGLLESRIEDYLGTRAVAFLNEWHGPNTRLSAWAVAPPPSPVDIEPARFTLPGGNAETLGLSAAGAQRDPVRAANAVLPLSLSWRAESAPPVLDVSVRLTDDLGQLWAQHDYEPLGGERPTGDEEPSCDICADKSLLRGQPWQAQDRLGLLIPAGTPPGRYHVEVVLHPKGDARSLNVMDDAGRLLGASARLFDITVGPADRPLRPENLPISTLRSVDLEGGLRLLGYSMEKGTATPGDERKVNLFWQATGRPSGEYAAFVQLLDRQGRVAAGWEAPPGAGYPTQAWEPGTLIRTQASIRVPADLPDGSYRLIGGLFRTGDKTRLRTAGGDDAFDLDRLTARGRPHDMNPPSPARSLNVEFDKLARLVGYDLTPPADGVSPGDTLPLTLHWQALSASSQPFTVFVQLLDDSGAILGSGDGEPGGGRYPTTGWLAAEYLTDPHAVLVRPDAPAGAYRLALGFYNPATGERLKTADGEDHVLLELPILVH